MEEYKGLKRGYRGAEEVFSYIDTYCKNQDLQILENDPILQKKVDKYYFKRKVSVFFFNVLIWSGFVFVAFNITKG